MALWYATDHRLLLTGLGDSLMQSFCARALHSEVFPVPGGPGKMQDK